MLVGLERAIATLERHLSEESDEHRHEWKLTGQELTVGRLDGLATLKAVCDCGAGSTVIAEETRHLRERLIRERDYNSALIERLQEALDNESAEHTENFAQLESTRDDVERLTIELDEWKEMCGAYDESGKHEAKQADEWRGKYDAATRERDQALENLGVVVQSYSNVEDRLLTLQEASRWRSVKEEPPGERGEVLIRSAQYIPFMCAVNVYIKKGQAEFWFRGLEQKGVEEWRPMP